MAKRIIYSKEITDCICKLIREGNHSNASICSLTGISESCFYNWQKKHVEFFQSLTRAREESSEKMVLGAKNSLLQMLKGCDIVTTRETTRRLSNGQMEKVLITETKHIEPDTKTIIFVLTNRDSKAFFSKVQSIVFGGRKHRRRSGSFSGTYKD